MRPRVDVDFIIAGVELATSTGTGVSALRVCG